MKVAVTALATTASLSIGLGFKPNRVRIRNVTDLTELVWTDKEVNGARFGVTVAAAGDKAAAASADYGIVLYDGEGPLAAASTTKIIRDDSDRKGSVAKFTLGSATNKTGNFDVACNTTYVGVGSKIWIGEKTYTITAITSTGETANYVTLDAAPPSGTSQISKITNKLDFIGAAKGEPVPAGITLGASAIVNNTNTDILLIEAENDL